MKKQKFIRFAPNIGMNGRLHRAVGAGGMAIVAVLCFWPGSWALGSAFALAAAFLAFEAARGWCALRACGVRTKF